jgi:hypothetical protein
MLFFFSLEHRLRVCNSTGTFGYFCRPHCPDGMVGTITVAGKLMFSQEEERKKSVVRKYNKDAVGFFPVIHFLVRTGKWIS